MDGLAGRAEYAQLLNDASEVVMSEPEPHQVELGGGGGAADTVTLELPVQRPAVSVPVIEVFLK